MADSLNTSRQRQLANPNIVHRIKLLARKMQKLFLVSSLLCFSLASCTKKRDDVEGFDASDADMLQAYSDTRESVVKFINALEERKSDHRYLVKFKVEADGEVEHMWGEPVSYSDGVFTGTLVNEPAKITSISIGDSLKATREEISDWAILDANDDFIAGAYTIEVMRSKEGETTN